MPLIKCPDCGREVSDQAPACVQCGRPIGGPSEVRDKDRQEAAYLESKGVLSIVGGMILFALVKGELFGRGTFPMVIACLSVALCVCGAIWFMQGRLRA